MIHFIEVIIKQMVIEKELNKLFRDIFYFIFLDPLLTKQKRSKVTGTKCKQVQILYNKIVSLFQGITDLIALGKFTDTIILAVSYFSVSIEIQSFFLFRSLPLQSVVSMLKISLIYKL